MIFPALRWLLPRPCPGCGGQIGREVGLCAACQATLQPRVESHSTLVARPEGHLVSLGRYEGRVRRAVRELKYARAMDTARPLGVALARGIPAEWGIIGVVAVPLHRQRERQRGFNQAELLARAIASELGVTYLPLLVRTRATSQQAKLHGAERLQNVAGAFAVRGTPPTGPLLLVDDVLTTAATLRACRDALQAAGVMQIKYAVVAH